MGNLMESRRRILLNIPHQITQSGSLVYFDTDMVAPLEITGTGNVTIAGKNMYDVNTRTLNYSINASGQEVSTNNFCCSALIPVNEGANILSYYSTLTSLTITRVHGYDASGNWVKQIDYRENRAMGILTLPFNVSSGIKYIRFGMWYTFYDVQVEFGNTATEYEAYRGVTSSALTGRKSLIGRNNIWSDSGNITVKYWSH